MKRFLLICSLLLNLCLMQAQDIKPCGTAVLSRRHQTVSSSQTRNFSPSRLSRAITPFLGNRRGLIILVSFPDQSFSGENPVEVWDSIANQSHYSAHGATGSVSDYFCDQSYGQFRLTFDVVGPVEAAHDYGYYGGNKDWGVPTGWFDQNVGELVEEACRGVAEQVYFADYDWDGDGEVEEVYILYAGHGENDYWYNDSTVIWPHMARLADDWEGYEDGLMLQGVRINTYACSNEISRYGTIAGMGTICHEFSHCLGLPDLYNTELGNSVLGVYDVMDQGNYSGRSWCPVGYSSYERYACGWLEPRPVSSLEEVGELQPLHEAPDACIFRTSADANDYYLIENRQKASWDAYIPTAGLLAWYIDYDEQAWADNTVNNDPDHLRVEHMTIDNVPSGISAVMPSPDTSTAVYDLMGNLVSTSTAAPLPPGIYILRSSDGKTKKVCQNS